METAQRRSPGFGWALNPMAGEESQMQWQRAAAPTPRATWGTWKLAGPPSEAGGASPGDILGLGLGPPNQESNALL